MKTTETKYKVDCPHCGEKMPEHARDGVISLCNSCGSAFEVFAGSGSGRLVLVAQAETKETQPLNLPKGSIRAAITLLLALCSWLMLLRQQTVPNYLFSLLLQIICHYFAFRKSAKSEGSFLYIRGEKQEEPLFLPNGFIRFVLMSGSLLAAIWLVTQNATLQNSFAQFLVLLGGLFLGYMSAKILGSHWRKHKHLAWTKHLKALAVLLGGLLLTFLMLSELHLHPIADRLCLLLAAGISFYFGSRS